MTHHIHPIGAYLQPRPGRVALHLGSALLLGTTTASTTAVSRPRRAFSRTPAHAAAPMDRRAVRGPQHNHRLTEKCRTSRPYTRGKASHARCDRHSRPFARSDLIRTT